MRVLGVLGSPRKQGNTHILMTRVLEGAERAGAKTELVPLGNRDIRECDGCHVCWQGKECRQQDDMNGLYTRIAASDCMVFGTPVYWYGPTALMKAFIDRLVYFNCPENRKKIAGKRGALVIPFEEQTTETADLTVQLFGKCLAYLEMDLGGVVTAPGAGKKGEINDYPEVLDQAFELGIRLGRG